MATYRLSKTAVSGVVEVRLSNPTNYDVILMRTFCLRPNCVVVDQFVMVVPHDEQLTEFLSYVGWKPEVTIAIRLRGGIVESVHASIPDVDVIVIDMDPTENLLQREEDDRDRAELLRESDRLCPYVVR